MSDSRSWAADREADEEQARLETAVSSFSSTAKTTISVYLMNGVIMEYDVSDPEKGREHAYEIIMSGYRSTPEGSNDLEWWPPHAIKKVKVNGAGESNYKDRKRAT